MSSARYRRSGPDFQPDDVESARLREPLPNGVVILASETVAGLMQLIVQLGHTNCDDIAVWLRFAYCNPVSVFEPFCAVAAWLMRTYRLACHIEANPAPDSGGLRDVADADAVRAVLLSSMEYNRRLWQMDADTEETAILRPGDAVARFIAPQFVRK